MFNWSIFHCQVSSPDINIALEGPFRLSRARKRCCVVCREDLVDRECSIIFQPETAKKNDQNPKPDDGLKVLFFNVHPYCYRNRETKSNPFMISFHIFI